MISVTIFQASIVFLIFLPSYRASSQTGGRFPDVFSTERVAGTMSFKVRLLSFFLLRSCFAQSTSPVGSTTATSPSVVTVTSVSTLAIIILPSSNSSIAPSTTATEPLNVNTTSSTTSILLPTTPYTGQAILVGTCNIPQYTGLALQDGAVIEVPLVGCSDDRPECCPSLSPPESTSSEMLAGSATTPTSNTTSLTATGVISMLSASPLSICPHDFTDISPVCCPSGYSLYGQAIVGNTPCYSMLSTIVPVPSAVSNSIISAVAQTASATATVSVIINQVFALGLPCADEPASGLSTGAKAGIGVGAGVGGLLLIGFVLLVLICIGKKRLRKRQLPPPLSTGYHQPQAKQMSASTGGMTSPASIGSPPVGQMSPQFHSQSDSLGFPARSAVYSAQSHTSWGSQPVVTNPPHYRAPVEMQAPQAYEIGDGKRAVSSDIPDRISSGDSTAYNSNISAYDAQRARSD